jgi:hypothetical protein
MSGLGQQADDLIGLQAQPAARPGRAPAALGSPAGQARTAPADPAPPRAGRPGTACGRALQQVARGTRANASAARPSSSTAVTKTTRCRGTGPARGARPPARPGPTAAVRSARARPQAEGLAHERLTARDRPTTAKSGSRSARRPSRKRAWGSANSTRGRFGCVGSGGFGFEDCLCMDLTDTGVSREPAVSIEFASWISSGASLSMQQACQGTDRVHPNRNSA